MSEEIIVLARIKAKEGLVEQVRQELASFVAPTRTEAGCISYDLHQGAEDQSLFMFYEQWAGKQALDEHLQKPHLKAFIAKADDILAEPMDVTIWKKLS